MRRTKLLLSALLVLLLYGSDSPKEYDDRTEMESIEGTWHKTTMETSDGRRLLPRIVFDDVESFLNGKYAVTGSGRSSIGTYAVDARHVPAQLDIAINLRNGGVQKQKFIYLVRGDTLQIGYPLYGNDRPHSFAQNSVLIETYKRVGK